MLAKFPTLVSKITRTYGTINDLHQLGQSLIQTIQTAVRPQWTCLLWSETNNNLLAVDRTYEPRQTLWFNSLAFKAQTALVEFFQRHRQPAVGTEILATLQLSGRTLTADEAKLLESAQIKLFVPIYGFHKLIGLLLLGSKQAGEHYDENDIEILEIATRQASVAIQNIQLISQLEARAREKEKYQRQVLLARESERKRLARELHDQVIQELVGLNYQLANIQARLSLSQLKPDIDHQALQLQEKVQWLIRTTRAICLNLRPPTLDLGLVPSIRSFIHDFEIKSGIEVDLTVTGESKRVVDEDEALCLFRCTQEACYNVRRHAQASRITITLYFGEAGICLTVADNGRGFVVPSRLGSLMKDDHFGLVGMRERVELMNGTLTVVSSPGSGTQIQVEIPEVAKKREEINE